MNDQMLSRRQYATKLIEEAKAIEASGDFSTVRAKSILAELKELRTHMSEDLYGLEEEQAHLEHAIAALGGFGGKSQPINLIRALGVTLGVKDGKIQPRDEEEAQLAAKVKAKYGDRGLDAVVAEMVEADPIWPRFYPRQYEDIGGYYPPKRVAAALAMVTRTLIRTGIRGAPAAHRLLATAIKPLVDHQMPMFFIAPDLVKAIQKTDFRDEIDWVDMALPFESGIFCLPKGALVHPKDGECNFIVWTRNRKGDCPPAFPGLPIIQLPCDTFSLVALCTGNYVWYDSNLSAAKRPTLRLHNLFLREPGEDYPQQVTPTQWDENTFGEDDENFLESIGVIVFGTLLAMETRPELLDRTRLIKRIPAKKDKPAREFWSPNIIGKHYHLKREPQGGTHASPRMHWRRGHFRNQPFGPQSKERKTIWIEPMLVGTKGAT